MRKVRPVGRGAPTLDWIGTLPPTAWLNLHGAVGVGPNGKARSSLTEKLFISQLFFSLYSPLSLFSRGHFRPSFRLAYHQWSSYLAPADAEQLHYSARFFPLEWTSPVRPVYPYKRIRTHKSCIAPSWLFSDDDSPYSDSLNHLGNGWWCSCIHRLLESSSPWTVLLRIFWR